jgi:hypothetical protein
LNHFWPESPSLLTNIAAMIYPSPLHPGDKITMKVNRATVEIRQIFPSK